MKLPLVSKNSRLKSCVMRGVVPLVWSTCKLKCPIVGTVTPPATGVAYGCTRIV